MTFILTLGCDRDDICAESTPTTPSLIIDFLDFNNNDSSKNVFNIAVIGVGNETILPEYNIITTNRLSLPLRTTENTTQYRVINNASVNDSGTPEDPSDDIIEGNEDIITINYSRENVYVSRACGFKTIFKNVTLTIETDSDNWMLSRIGLNDNQSVENETTTHFNILH